MAHPIVKTIVCSGCHSYLIGCPETRRALLVDPKVGREPHYEHFLARLGLELDAVLDTHTHADHLSASASFVAAGVRLLMSAETTCKREKQALEDGDVVEVGELSFRVLAIPGHTPDSIGLVGHGFVLTGDSLFVGSLARADFKGSDPARLYDSVQTQLMTLPDETLVFPGHGYNDILFSTIGVERATNPAFAAANATAYVESLGVVPGAGNTPAVDSCLEANLSAAPELPRIQSPVATCCAAPSAAGRDTEIREELPEALRESLGALVADGRWVDVRDSFEFEATRIPGTRSIPLSELGFHLGELRSEDALYLSCRSGQRSMTAARTLAHLGVAAEPVNVVGGILLWQERGFPIEGVPVS